MIEENSKFNLTLKKIIIEFGKLIYVQTEIIIEEGLI